MIERVFNKGAYDIYDKPAKRMLEKIVKKYNLGEIISGSEEEQYTKGDLIIKKEDGKVETYEAEVRGKYFQVILDTFDTIHIPARKRNFSFDYYVIFNSSFTKMILIQKKIFQLFKHNITIEECNKTKERYKRFEDIFINIPVKYCHLYDLKEDGTVKRLCTIEEYRSKNKQIAG